MPPRPLSVAASGSSKAGSSVSGALMQSQGLHRGSSCRPPLRQQAAPPARERSESSGGTTFLDSVSGTSSGASGAPRLNPDEQGRVFGTQLAPGSTILPLSRCPGTSWSVSFFQHIGDRKTQEDRFAVVPTLDPDGRTPSSFFGVFDGTVGDFASHNVKDLVIPKLFQSEGWTNLKNTPTSQPQEQEKWLEQAMKEMFREADDALLQLCAKNNQHYATSTGVTAVLYGDLLAVAHLGDSRIILGKETSEPGQLTPALVGEQLTIDHKPDQEHERARIERCGGMVERLPNHNNKPFIRGGDFLMRKSLGEQPMQLQYSRAFGAKDLKIFGLSNVPDVRTLRISRDPYRKVRFLILASDGLWDVLSSQNAVLVAQHAVSQDANPAEALVRQALLEQSRRKARADNITAVCVVFDRRDRGPTHHHVASSGPGGSGVGPGPGAGAGGTL